MLKLEAVFIDAYVIMSEVLTLTELGWPTSRPRRWTLLVHRGLVLAQEPRLIHTYAHGCVYIPIASACMFIVRTQHEHKHVYKIVCTIHIKLNDVCLRVQQEFSRATFSSLFFRKIAAGGDIFFCAPQEVIDSWLARLASVKYFASDKDEGSGAQVDARSLLSESMRQHLCAYERSRRRRARRGCSAHYLEHSSDHPGKPLLMLLILW